MGDETKEGKFKSTEGMEELYCKTLIKEKSLEPDLLLKDYQGNKRTNDRPPYLSPNHDGPKYQKKGERNHVLNAQEKK